MVQAQEPEPEETTINVPVVLPKIEVVEEEPEEEPKEEEEENEEEKEEEKEVEEEEKPAAVEKEEE